MPEVGEHLRFPVGDGRDQRLEGRADVRRHVAHPGLVPGPCVGLVSPAPDRGEPFLDPVGGAELRELVAPRLGPAAAQRVEAGGTLRCPRPGSTPVAISAARCSFRDGPTLPARRNRSAACPFHIPVCSETLFRTEFCNRRPGRATGGVSRAPRRDRRWTNVPCSLFVTRSLSNRKMRIAPKK